MEFFSARGSELTTPDLGRFYKRHGYKGKLTDSDLCFWLCQANLNNQQREITAAAKITLDSNSQVLILRGVWVHKLKRQQGLGAALLTYLLKSSAVRHKPLYCFAYDSVAPFYHKLGFKSCSAINTPKRLFEQQKRYKQRGNDTQLMFIETES